MQEKRINELEIKFTIQEDLLDELNQIVTKQQYVIDQLTKDVKRLLQNQGTGGADTSGDEKPPHY